MARHLVFSFLIISFAHAVFAQHGPLAGDEIDSRTERLTNFSHSVDLRRWEIAGDTIDQWRQWEMVDNYSFGINRGGMSMIADLESLHPYFRDKVLALIRVCKSKGIELAVVETYRTQAKQREYKAMGRRYTTKKAGHSRHQYGLAIDVVPMKDSIPQWRNIRLWKKIGPLGERLGLRWGGRFRRLFDPGHFEWTGGVPSTSLAKGQLPGVPNPALYPCLDEDIRELRRHWKAWEVEQTAIARLNTKSRNTRHTASASAPRVVLRGGED